VSIEKLNELQRAAHDGVLELVKTGGSTTTQATLIGYAGTGKTFTVSALRKSLADLGLNVLTVAPTNKAVRVLGQGITVHKALGIAVDSQGRERMTSMGPQLDGVDLLIVDESSMISRRMHAKVVAAACEAEVRCILWVGDDAQLPPVEDDGELSPALRCQTSWRLTKIERGNPDECGASILGASIRKAIEEGRQYTVYDMLEVGPLPGVEYIPHGQPPAWVDPSLSHLSTPGQLLYSGLAMGLDARAASYTNEATTSLAQELRMFATGHLAPSVGEVLSFNKPFIEFDGGRESVIYTTDEEVTVSKVSEVRQGLVTGIEHVVLSVDGDARKIRVPLDIHDWLSCMRKVSAHRDDARKRGDSESLDTCRAWLDELRTMTDLRSVYSSTVHKLQGSTVEMCVVDMHNIQRAIRGGSFEVYNRMLYVAVTRPKIGLCVVY
jgi:hypothetical protein